MDLELSEASPTLPYTTNPNGSRKWTQGQLDDIMLQAEAKVPYSKICEYYGTTRGAIAGLVKRERERRSIPLPMQIKRAERAAKAKAAAEAKAARPTNNYTFNPSFVGRRLAPQPRKRVRLKLIDNPNYVTFAELQPHHCKWPFGDPKNSDFRFCGCDRVANKPYCAAHIITAGKLYEQKGNS